MVEKSMVALDSNDHHGHAQGILDVFVLLDATNIAETWQRSSMAIVSAQRHIDALFDICQTAEAESEQLRKQLKQLEESKQ